MPFPQKFKPILEPDPASIPRPDYVWLAYAACGVEPTSCGWSGWVIEGAFRHSTRHAPTSTGDELLPADDELKCPRCNLALFRTGIALRCEPPADQESPVGEPGADYDVAPMEYE